MQLNILICGIGGQGVVFFGNFLKKFLYELFPNVLITGTESRGVSQREGSVTSSVRMVNSDSNQFIGPDIPLHKADIIIAYEPIELLRNINLCHDKTVIIVNNNPIVPKNTLKQINKGVESEIFKTIKEPELIIEKVAYFIDKISSQFKVNEVNTDSHIKDFVKNIESKAIRNALNEEDNIEHQEKNMILKLNRFSKKIRLIDFDLTSTLIEKTGSMSGINFVFFGILQGLFDTLFPIDETIGIIKDYFQQIG